jgi:glycerol-3-phosphate acyltransferase PlsX
VTAPRGRRVTVALDLLGGDHAPAAVVDGALTAMGADPELTPVLVGPPQVAAALLAERGAAGACEVVPASEVVGMAEDPARAVRAKRDATVRVAARLVRDGRADATVSIGSTGAAMAAALFTLGRLPGISRPALAALIPGQAHPVVIMDVGAGVEATPALLVQFALAGAAYAAVRLGLQRPRVGLLSVGTEPGKGDPLRKQAFAELAAALAPLPIDFAGNVEGHHVPLGGPADVVLTDGFAGNLLLKAMEGTYQLVVDSLGGDAAARTAALSPEGLNGAVLLGVKGVVVIGHGASRPGGVATCLQIAGQAVREGLVERTAAALAELVGSAAGGAAPAAGSRPAAGAPVGAARTLGRAW